MPSLLPPTLRLVAQTATSVSLTWTDPNPQARGTEVQRSQDAGPPVTLATPGKGVQSWSDMFLPAATTSAIQLTYQVRARAKQGWVSAWSNPVTVSIPAIVTPPPPPTLLTPTLTATLAVNVAKLSWTDPNAGTTTTSVERSVAGAAPVIVATTPIGTSTWTDSALPSGPTPITVTYQVRAVKSTTVSGWSNVATIVTPAEVATGPQCTGPILADGLDTTINAAIQAASPGNVICVPAGTWDWTSTVVIDRAITLKGAGIGQTIITDDVSPRSGGANNGSVLNITSASTAAWRVTGFSFLVGGAVADSGAGIRCGGGSHAFRFDHVHIEGLHAGIMLEFTDDLRGVAHNIEVLATGGKFPIQVNHPKWNGETANIGHFSYADDSNWGSANFVFVEQSTISTLGSSVTGLDGQAGGRWVMRYSTLNDTIFACHGTESGNTRGMRAVEVYNNTFNLNKPWNVSVVVGFRAGTGLIHDNTLAGTSLDSNHFMATGTPFRARDQFPNWGTADCAGTGQFDRNLATNVVTGTAQTGSGTDSLVDATKDFTTACGGGACGNNGYSFRNTTQGWGSYIKSNTGTTLATEASAFGQSHAIAAGDSYQINQVYPCLDQPGMGKSDLLSGLPPTPTGWPNQTFEPIYVWSNTLGPVQVSASSMTVLSGRDIIGTAPPFSYTPYPYPHPLRSTP